MPRPVISTDGFPHGTTRGYGRGCGCRPCTDASTRARKRQRLLRQRGITTDRGFTPAAPIRAHIHHLLKQDPQVNCSVIGRIAGVDDSTVQNIATGKQPSARHRVAAALLAVTPEQVITSRTFTCVEPLKPLVRQMQAAGYSIAWVAEQLGLARLDFMFGDSHTISLDLAHKLRQLHARFADTPATVENSGQSPLAIKRNGTIARKNGWWPIWHLRPDGTVDWRSIPGHPWSVADEKAAVRLDAIRACLGGQGSLAISERFGLQRRTVERWLEAVGCRPSDSPDRRRHAQDLLDAYDYGTADPIITCLRLGLNFPDIPRNHPAWVEHTRTSQMLPAAA